MKSFAVYSTTPTLVLQRTSRPRISTKITERSIQSVSERPSRAAGKTKRITSRWGTVEICVPDQGFTCIPGLSQHLNSDCGLSLPSTRGWNLVEGWRRFIAGVLVHEIELVIPREGGRMLAFSRCFFGFIFSYSNLAFVFGILVHRGVDGWRTRHR